MSTFGNITRQPFFKLKMRNPLDKTNRIYAYVGLFLFVMAIFYVLFLKPPQTFEEDIYFEVEKGSSLVGVSETLKEEGLIKSRFMFQAFAVILGGEKSMVAGDYYFEKPINSISIAHRLSKGVFKLKRYFVTLQEGFTIEHYGTVLEKELPKFDRSAFIRMAEGKEGFLFPDSYFFFETATEEDVLMILEDTFEDKMSDFMVDAEERGKTFEDIIIMASIIQREANNNLNEMKTISGILWNRLDRGMALQVDATFKYYKDKASSELTKADLQEDHPFNTYVNKGLPPAPIGNPGVKAVKAALNPTNSSYVFYLHDRNGGVHYAVTHDQHVANKKKYLK